MNQGLDLWKKDNNCPLTCTCQLEHLTESAIYRFMQKEKNKAFTSIEATSVEYNDVS